MKKKRKMGQKKINSIWEGETIMLKEFIITVLNIFGILLKLLGEITIFGLKLFMIMLIATFKLVFSVIESV